MRNQYSPPGFSGRLESVHALTRATSWNLARDRARTVARAFTSRVSHELPEGSQTNPRRSSTGGSRPAPFRRAAWGRCGDVRPRFGFVLDAFFRILPSRNRTAAAKVRGHAHEATRRKPPHHGTFGFPIVEPMLPMALSLPSIHSRGKRRLGQRHVADFPPARACLN